MPGGMQARDNGHAGGELGAGERTAVGPSVAVVAGPGQVERPLAGRRACGERGVRPRAPPVARFQPVRASQAAIFVMSANTGPGVARAPMPA